ncbi:MAG TPA: hypothetical protein VMS65_10250 [Polyangiaceae bacterium]|nr:hypothetical protein [Polyangiaceae bacterium]
MGNVDELDSKTSTEEVPSAVRHALRNKLAAMRNSVFYIHKSLSKMGVVDHDPRVPRFLELIEAEIDEADRLLDSRSRPAATELPSTSPPESQSRSASKPEP